MLGFLHRMHLCKQRDNRKTSNAWVNADHVNHALEGTRGALWNNKYTVFKEAVTVSRSQSEEIRIGKRFRERSVSAQGEREPGGPGWEPLAKEPRT